MKDRLTEIMYELADRDFSLAEIPRQDLREVLAARIGELLEKNPILLRSIFYRIDLNEVNVGIALHTMSGEELHRELADQVIERIRKKAETRLKYSG